MDPHVENKKSNKLFQMFFLLLIEAKFYTMNIVSERSALKMTDLDENDVGGNVSAKTLRQAELKLRRRRRL